MKSSNSEIKKDSEALNVNKDNNTTNKDNNKLSDISKKIKRETKINVFRVIINFIFCIFILGLTYFVINNYEEKWEMAYFLTIWSFFMNAFYIVSVTAIDITRLLKNTDYCITYNNFVRKYYLRICFPFSLSIVFLFWMLILLGDDFQYNSRDLWDFLVNFCFHGLQFVFLLHDTLTYPHQVEINKLCDFIVITIMTVIYFIILGFGKYMMDFEPYDFMSMSNIRQIAGAAFLIYIGILDGYVVFVLIVGKCFVDKSIDMDKIRKEIIRHKMNEKNKKEKKENKDDNNNDKTIEDVKQNENKILSNKEIMKNNIINNENNNANININNQNDINNIILPKLTRKKLKPIQLSRNINNNIELNEDKKE